MKQRLLTMLLALFVVAAAFAGKEDTYVLYEGFESGAIPADWSMEYVTDYQQPWLVETSADATYPSGSYAGGYHVALRNNTNQTQHYVTRLVTPFFDIASTFQPILVFSHAQAQRTGDVDILRVYYRTSPKSRWVQIGEYTDKVTTWKTDTISLTAPNETYQLAFEGVDKFGRGIVLDDIIVRPTPTCDDPLNISTDGLTTNSCILRWNGSLDTDSFHVVLSTAKQTDPEQPTDIVHDTYVNDFQWTITGLKQNARYYAYVQAHCNDNVSEWVEYSFRTKNLVSLPYTQDFNMPYQSGTIYHVSYWSNGTSILKENGDMEYMPYVNTNTSTNRLKNYSYSGTTALIFTGARVIDTPIPAGHYVYAATPELDTDDIRKLQVQFWGTCATYVSDNYVSGLIVGVMTDPSDFSTFVPVDTVYVKESNTYERFTVYLDKYQGEGKYVGFASNFVDKDNIFYLDDVEIKEQSSIKLVSDIQIGNYGVASFNVSANTNGSSRVELWVMRDSTDLKSGKIFFDPMQLPADYVLVRQELDASELPYKIQLPQGGRFVQVYMRGVSGAEYGEFSLPKKVLVPMQILEYPFVTEFRETDPTGIWMPLELDNYSSSAVTYKFPFSVLTTKTNPCHEYWPQLFENVMILRKDIYDDDNCVQEVGDYVAFPAIGADKNVMMRFTMKNRSSVPKNSRVVAGLMTDPFDPSTFDTLVVFDGPDDAYRPFIVSFADYKGKGVFPAIMAATAEQRYSDHLSYTAINDVTISLMEGCIIPSDIVCTPEAEKATVVWNANGMSKWLVKLYADEQGKTLLESVSVTTNKCVLENLKPHTTYYYSVHTDCDTIQSDGDIYKFVTECAPKESLPYIEDFEGWTGGSRNATNEPMCWTINRIEYTSRDGDSYTTSYEPYISTYDARKGDKCFQLSYTGSINASIRPKVAYIALPEMEKDLNLLQIQFYAKPAGPAYVGDTLFVGVMSDPENLSTFDTIATCRLTGTAYAEYIIRLNTYQGQGKYIAFATAYGKETRSIYLDDIKVDYLSDCEKVQGVSTRNSTEMGADVYWQKGDATQWEVVLTTDTMTLGSIVEVDSTKVLALLPANTMPVTLNQCPKTNTTYYVYVRSICGETNKGEWSNPVSFKTTCVALPTDEMGLIDFSNKNELDCWTVGVREGTTNAPKRDTDGYLYMFNTNKSDGAYAIMPPLDIDSISRLQVSFDAHGGKDPTYLREVTVGVISNPSDLSTFTAIATLPLNKVSATTADINYGFNEAARYTVRFNTYDGDYNGDYGKQIMFLSESGDKANYIYIDNIKVDTIGTCMEPVTIRATELNANDVTICWDDLGGDYQVQLLDAKGETLLQDIIVSDTNAVTLSGLDMLTTYKVQIRHICAADEYSVWSNRMQFKTACPAAYPLSYSEDFENYPSAAGSYPDCWDILTSSTSTTLSSTPSVSASAKKDGAKGFHLYRSTTHYTYAVLPRFALPANQLMLSFDVRNTSTSNAAYFQVGVATDITGKEGIDNTFTLLDSVRIEKYVAAEGWTYYTKILDEYTGQDGYIVIIAPTADVTANNGTVYIDNLYVEKAPTCFRPINLEALSSTTATITLQWTPFGKESAWDIAYVPTGGKMEDATIITVDSSYTVVSGLAHSTEYDFYVRANCGNGDVSEWTSSVSFRTLSLVELADAHWNFDDINTQHQSELSTVSTYKIENGWVVGNTKSPTTVGNIPYNIKNTYYTDGTRNGHYALSDSCALKIGVSTAANNGAYAVLPEINADLDGLQIRFSGRAVHATGSKVSNTDSVYYTTYATGSYKHGIKIGTMTNPYDPSTFELLCDYTFKEVKSTESKVIAEDGHWEEVVVPLYGASGKYIAFVSDYNANNIVYIDDVVVEAETGCAVPMAVNIADSLLSYDKATATWKSGKQQWQAQLLTGDSVVETVIVNKPTWALTQLEPLTDYTVRVRAICGVADTSAWSAIDFATPCAPFDRESYTFNFEDNLYKYVSTFNIPQCWDAGQLVMANTSTTTYMPQAIANTTSYQYSRNVTSPVTAGRALRLYNYLATYSGSYVILPETNFDLDSVCLHFWARAAYFFPANATNANNRNRLYIENNNYQKSIIIGAIADMNDPETFVPLDTFTYSQSWSTSQKTSVYTYNDETGNDYWEEVLIPLKKYAGKGRIAIVYPGNGKTSYFFIDDMEIVAGDFCSMATNLRVSNIHANSADLSWVTVGMDSVQLQLAYNTDFDAANTVVDTVLVNTGGRFHATNLLNGRDYYFRVRHFCSEEEVSDWAQSNLFVTDYAVRFVQNFDINRTYPVDWQRANSVPEAVFANTVQLNYVGEDIDFNWRNVPGIGLIANREMYAATSNGTGVTNNYWLVTPTIDLTMLPADTTLMLSFRLGLTNQAGGPANPTGEGDKFIIAVSEDAGETWHADTYWSDNAEDNATYSYAAIPAKGQLYNVDMTKYMGKRIRIAFINSSTKTASKNYLRLATVSLNYVEIEDYLASICQWNDYKDANFSIDADDLIVGETTTYSFFRQATDNGKADQYANMALTVHPDVRTILNAEICEGADYVADNFLIENANISRTYKQKLVGTNTCDSVVVLNLNVIPRIRSDVYQTICRGDFYEFNGEKYYLNTVHTDTLSSLVTGCDSITTLYLTVNAILEGENEVHLCQGESVEFGKYGVITEAGTYQDTLKNALNCDSVATLHVYTHAAEATTVRALICQGDRYSNGVWSGLTKAGDYPSQQKTIWGCDSIATLHLLVAGESLTLTDSIGIDQLPYILNDMELLPEGTSEGVYVRSVTLNCGVATLTIVVGQPMANPSVFVNSLAITPNPVRVNEPVRIVGNFATDAAVEVISSTGGRIYYTDRAASPVTIPGIPAEGVYIVTVTSNGQLYQSKLIVK